MKRTRIATLALVAVLTCGVGLSRAESAAPAAAPADNGEKAAEPASGCMPDGSCCGKAACAHAAAGADKAATGAATGEAAGTAADTADGGCPCAKMKKKAM